MRQALLLARRGPRGVNPQVGAVLLSPTGETLAEHLGRAFGTEAKLAGDEYQPVRPGRLDDVTVARRLCERLRIGKAAVAAHAKSGART